MKKMTEKKLISRIAGDHGTSMTNDEKIWALNSAQIDINELEVK